MVASWKVALVCGVAVDAAFVGVTPGRLAASRSVPRMAIDSAGTSSVSLEVCAMHVQLGRPYP